jgi:predicted AAA+ superfamily ATPase
MRYLDQALRRDLSRKLVLLAGPRQCGKTTFARSLLDARGEYLNWDITADRRIIRATAWPKSASLVVLDELHKAPKWKNLLKGLVDEFHNRPPLLVTGSARLDALRKTGDALTGRYYFYRLHPVDVAESREMLPGVSLAERVSRLLRTGGFPESYLHPADAARLRNDRLDLVIREDLADLSRISAWQGARDLIELLRERVGKPVSYASLAQDLGISAPTAKSWVELLEKLYIVFLLPPYSKRVARGIRKEKRVFFYDCAAAFDETGGAQLENLVACCLLRFVQYRRDCAGENWDLAYLRDREQREVDFVVTLNRRVHWLIEVKKSDDSPSSGLQYFHSRLKPQQSIQLVHGLNRPLERSGISIVPLGKWLDETLRDNP